MSDDPNKKEEDFSLEDDSLDMDLSDESSLNEGTIDDDLLDDALLDDELLDDDFLDEKLDDEDWSDLDEDEDDGDLMEAGASAPKAKSPIAKYFSFIVIGVVLIFGGLFALSQLGGGSKTAPPAQSPQPQAVASNQTTQNNAATTQSSDNDRAIAVELNDLRGTEDTPKAVLPYEDAITQFDQVLSEDSNNSQKSVENMSEEDDIFSDLETINPDDQPVIQKDVSVPSAAASGYVDDAITFNNDSDDEAPLLPMPNDDAFASDDTIDISPLPQEEQTSEPIIANASETEAEIVFNNVDDTNDIDSIFDAIDDNSEEPATIMADEPIAEEPAEDMTVVATDTDNQPNSFNDTAPEITQLKDQISSLEQENKSIKTTYQQEKASLTQEVNTLKAQIASLEKEIKSAETSKTILPKATPQPAKQASKPAAHKSEPASSTVDRLNQERNANTQPRANTYAGNAQDIWVMKAAQPGFAVLQHKKNGNVIQIKPGQQVAGFGVVRSIRFDNGSWLITGSQSSLKR